MTYTTEILCLAHGDDGVSALAAIWLDGPRPSLVHHKLNITIGAASALTYCQGPRKGLIGYPFVFERI